jgi:hypothetical protein
MAMVITLKDDAAVRASELAAAAGVSTDEVVAQLVLAAPLPAGTADPARDALEAFIGCGASGDRQDRTIQQLRDELSAAQLDQSA